MLNLRFAFNAIAMTACFASSIFAQGATATTVTRTFTFAPVGLASSETAQINVTNVAATSSRGTAASCTGNISFLNAAGAVIGTATNFTVTTGQISSVALPFSRAASTGSRVEVRGAVQLTTPTTNAPPCSLEFSLETYDTVSGVTHLFLSNSAGQSTVFNRGL
jgi:hypothetical protein